jgi:hypothetical protein
VLLVAVDEAAALVLDAQALAEVAPQAQGEEDSVLIVFLNEVDLLKHLIGEVL